MATQWSPYSGSPQPDPIQALEPPRYATLSQQLLDGELARDYQPPYWQTHIRLDSPMLTGTGAATRQVQGGYSSEGFPTRMQFDLSADDPINRLFNGTMQGPVGVALGAAGGQQRGGAMSIGGFQIATTPLTLANFSSWGRERTLAALTYALSGGQGKYQTPAGASFGQENVGPAVDKRDPVDMAIQGILTPFNMINGAINGVMDFWRTENALARAQRVRSLVTTGQADEFRYGALGLGFVDAIVTHLTPIINGGAAKYSADAIAAMATEHGLDYETMMSELYDLDPKIVRQIMANPTLDDNALRGIVHNAPLSLNPVVNMGLEAGAQLALLTAPFGLGKLGRLAGAGEALGGLAEGTALEGVGAGLSRGLAGTRAAADVASRGEQLAQLAGWAARKGMQINSVNTTVGWTIGGMEWSLKQIGVTLGNQGLVDTMDKMMWEMPLSMNPGVNIVNAFGAHPLQAIGLRFRGEGEPGLLQGRVQVGMRGTGGAVGELRLGLRNLSFRPFEDVKIGAKTYGPSAPIQIGRYLLGAGPDGTKFVGELATATIDDLYNGIYAKAGFEREWLDAAFGEGNKDGLTLDDLRNVSMGLAMRAKRDDMGEALRFAYVDKTPYERFLHFVDDYLEPSYSLWKSDMRGESSKMADAIKGQYWQLEQLNDTRYRQIKAHLMETFDPTTGFREFLSFAKIEKLLRTAYESPEGEALRGRGIVGTYRQSVNLDFLASYREQILAKYQPDDLVDPKDLQQLKTFGGMVEMRGQGGKLVRQRGKRFPPMTRTQLEEILNSIERDEKNRLEAPVVPHTNIASLKPGADMNNPFEQARVLGVSQTVLRQLQEAAALPDDQLVGKAFPRDLARAISRDTSRKVDELMADPVTAWQRAREWMDAKMGDAVTSQKAREELESFKSVLSERQAQSGVNDVLTAGMQAADDAKLYLLNPIDKSWLVHNPSMAMRVSEALGALEALEAKMRNLAADPARKARWFNTAEGMSFLTSKTPLDWMNTLLDLIDKVRKSDRTLPADVDLLADPTLHPLLKVDALYRADLTPAERAFLDQLGPEDLRPLLEDMGIIDATTPVDANAVAQATAKAESWGNAVDATAGELDAIGRRLTQMDSGGSSPEMIDTFARLDQWSNRHDVDWRKLPTFPQEVSAANLEAFRAGERRIGINAKLAKAQLDRDAAAADLQLIQSRDFTPEFDYSQPKVIVRRGGSKEAARVAKQYRDDTGLPTTWRAVKKPSGGLSHYEVYVGRLQRRTGAEGAIQQAANAGDAETLARLNLEAEAVNAEKGKGGPVAGFAEEAARLRAEQEAAAVTGQTEIGSPQGVTPPDQIDFGRPEPPKQKEPLVVDGLKYRIRSIDGGRVQAKTSFGNRWADVRHDSLTWDKKVGVWRTSDEHFLTREGEGSWNTNAADRAAMRAEDFAHDAEVRAALPDLTPEEIVARKVDFEAQFNPNTDPDALADALLDLRDAGYNVTAARDALSAVYDSLQQADELLKKKVKALDKKQNEEYAAEILGRVPDEWQNALDEASNVQPLDMESESAAFYAQEYIDAHGEPPPWWTPDQPVPEQLHTPDQEAVIAQVDAQVAQQGEHLAVPSGPYPTGDVNALVDWWARNHPPIPDDPWGQKRGAMFDVGIPRARLDELHNATIDEARANLEAPWPKMLFDLAMTDHPEKAHSGPAIRRAEATFKQVKGQLTRQQQSQVTDWIARAKEFYKTASPTTIPPREWEAIREGIGEKWAARKQLLQGEIDAARQGLTTANARRLLEQGFDPAEVVSLTGNTPRAVVNALDQMAAERGLLQEPAPPAPRGVDRPFPNPMNVTEEVPATFKLVELDDLRTSADEGFPPELQPRQRERISSQEQIGSIARKPKFDLYLRSETGAEGTPLVTAANDVLAGNGRTLALRQMSAEQLAAYKTRLRNRATEFGLTPEQVDAMRSPVLVREVPQEFATPEMANALNAATGGMSSTEMAVSLARQITPADLNALDLGEKVTLRDALTAEKNAPFVQRVLSTLTPEQRRAWTDAKGALNADGYRAIANGLLARVIPDAGIVARFVESLDDDLGRIRTGVEQSLGQLVEAQGLIDAGQRFPNAAIGDTLAEAINRVIDVKARKVPAKDVPLELTGTSGMFDQAATQTAGELALTLYNMRSVDEVRDFLRGYAKAVKESPDPTQLGMFGNEPTKLTDLLNSAVKDINEARGARNEQARLVREQKATEGMFGEEGLAQAKELPLLQGFTDETGTVPIRFQNTAGVESIAREVPVEDAGAAVDARIGPHAQHYIEVDDPLDPAAYAGAEKGVSISVRVPNENYRLAMEQLLTDPPAWASHYRALEQRIRSAGGMALEGSPGRAEARRFFDEAAARLNAGQGTGADLLFLREMSHGRLLRFDEAGQLNSKPNFAAKLPPDVKVGHLTSRFRPVTDMPALTSDDAAVLSSSKTPNPNFENTTGFKPEAPPSGAVPAIESGAHTFVKGGAPEREARAHTGAPSPREQNAMLEANPPDEATLLRLGQERFDAADRAVREQEAALDALPPAAAAPEATFAPIPPEISDLLMDYTNAPGKVTSDIVKGAVGREARSVGEVVDALESLDMGVPPLGKAMTPDQLVTLRQGLADWLDQRMKAEGGLPENRQRARARQTEEQRLARTIIDKPEDYLAALRDGFRALERVVKTDDQVITGWEGTQYDLGPVRTKDVSTGAPLSPRILPFDYLAALDKISPDMSAELAMGRKQAWLDRVYTARFQPVIGGAYDALRAPLSLVRESVIGKRAGDAWDTVFGPRPERDIRLATINRFTDELVGPIPEQLDESALAEYMRSRRQAADIIRSAHDYMTQEGNLMGFRPLGRYPRFRRVGLIPPRQFEELAWQGLTGKKDPTFADLPEWAKGLVQRNVRDQIGPDMKVDTVLAQSGKMPFFEAYRFADNRIRGYFADRPGGMAEMVEKLYQRASPVSAEAGRLTVMYHTYRFLLDVRWQALEKIEAPLITMSREGIGAVLEAMGIKFEGFKPTRGGAAPKPLFMGLDDLSARRGDYAWWLSITDPGLGIRFRENYLLTLVKRRQLADFPEVLMDMAKRDPELMATMKTFGETPSQWLQGLADTWELKNAMSRRIGTQEAKAIFGPRVADGSITPKEYERVLEAARKGEADPAAGFQYVRIPSLEAELARVDNPATAALLGRLRTLNEMHWQDAAELIFGQVDRSNFQRFFNSPLLYWPLSYQIKATKWLATVLFDRMAGVDTGSLGALMIDKLHAEHRDRLENDPHYQAFFAQHPTLIFAAQMLLPITPFDIGISLSPFTRLGLSMASGNGSYARNIFAVGPGYTMFSLLPRLAYEELKSAPAGSPQAAIAQGLSTVVPYSIPVGHSTSRQQQAAQQSYGGLPIPTNLPLPQPPTNRYSENQP